MPEPENHLPSAAVLADVLAGQAAALHVVFMCGFLEMLLDKKRSLRDASRTLKAQNQCRMAFGLLLKLQALEQTEKKSRNRTSRLLKEENPNHDQALGKTPQDARLCPPQTPPQRVGVVPRTPRWAGGADPRLGALEKGDRSPNGRRQGPLRPECLETRLPKPRLHSKEARRAAASPRVRRDHRACQAPPPRRLSHRCFGQTLDPTSSNAGRSKRRREARRFGWADCLQRSRTCAPSSPHSSALSPCLDADQSI